MTSMRVGGELKGLQSPKGFGDAVRILDAAAKRLTRARVIGGGTNLLVDDSGADFPVISTRYLRRMRIRADGSVFAEAGVPLFKVVVACARAGLSGLEPLAGIPGTIGGAVVMNAGAFGASVSDRLESAVVAFPLEGATLLDRKDMPFGYRRSGLSRALVLGATFRLVPDSPESVRERVKSILEKRRGRHPRGIASAGCFFRNPGKVSAGLLIEKAGLKGARIGGAMVSPVHANFIVNLGRASCLDVLSLAGMVRDSVLRKTGIRLKMEVRYWKSAATRPAARRAVALASEAE